MRYGFRVGFNYGVKSCASAKSNMHSALENSQVIDEYLGKEATLGRVVGPFDPAAFPSVHASHFGVIPKGRQVAKWRLIVALSHLAGASVNDGIESELCSLTYTSVDKAVKIIAKMGVGTHLGKVDIESAYRIVPIHPDDRLLLGMVWRGKLYPW